MIVIEKLWYVKQDREDGEEDHTEYGLKFRFSMAKAAVIDIRLHLQLCYAALR